MLTRHAELSLLATKTRCIGTAWHDKPCTSAKLFQVSPRLLLDPTAAGQSMAQL
jgi:hypothetical protein